MNHPNEGLREYIWPPFLWDEILINIPNIIGLIVLKGYHWEKSFKPYLKEKEVNEFEGLLTIITSQNWFEHVCW